MKLLVKDIKTGKQFDVSKNLYWFEENGVQEMSERGECEGQHGEKYQVIFEETIEDRYGT